jgi:hypothetical protein
MGISRRHRTVAPALILIAGCHESGASLPLSGLEAKGLQANCEYGAKCGDFPDVETCKTSASPASLAQMTASVNAGRVQYDANAAATCLNDVASMGCNRADQGGNGPLSCANMFKGLVAGGGACYVDQDCASGTCDTSSCSATVTCCAGTCRNAPPVSNPVPVGGDCLGVNAVCVDGTYCRHLTTGDTCTTGIALGRKCDPSGVSCANYATCLSSSSTLGGTCTLPPAEGDACDRSINPCNSSLDYCDSATSKCVRKIAPGQPCPNGDGCVRYANCLSGICVAQKKVGETCDDTQSAHPCMSSLWCNGGTCVVQQLPPACQ